MTIKVQLKRDLPELGRTGQIVQVSQAHARNFLLPKGLAVVATAKVVAAAAQAQASQQASQNQTQTDLTKLEAQLAQATIRLSGRANAQGKLFAALKIDQVLQAIDQQLHLRLPPGATMQPETLKTLGDHAVTLQASRSSFICRIHIDHAET